MSLNLPPGGDDDPTVASLVDDHMSRDIHMETALARGYLSLRRAARWIQDRYEWDANEEAIVSALRRHEPSKQSTRDEDLLAGANATAQTGLCMVTVPAVPEIQAQVPKAEATIDEGGFWAQLPGSDHVRLVFEVQHEDSALQVLHENAEEDDSETRRGVARVTFAFPDTGADPAIGASVVLTHLARDGIEIIGQTLAGSELTVFVHEAQLSDTFSIAEHLKGNARR